MSSGALSPQSWRDTSRCSIARPCPMAHAWRSTARGPISSPRSVGVPQPTPGRLFALYEYCVSVSLGLDELFLPPPPSHQYSRTFPGFGDALTSALPSPNLASRFFVSYLVYSFHSTHHVRPQPSVVEFGLHGEKLAGQVFVVFSWRLLGGFKHVFVFVSARFQRAARMAILLKQRDSLHSGRKGSKPSET